MALEKFVPKKNLGIPLTSPLPDKRLYFLQIRFTELILRWFETVPRGPEEGLEGPRELEELGGTHLSFSRVPRPSMPFTGLPLDPLEPQTTLR